MQPGCWEFINARINQVQSLLDKRQYIPRIMKLDLRGTRGRMPSREAAINEALRGFSPCGITAEDCELNAEGALAEQRAKRNR
jgi:hypothetical protein